MPAITQITQKRWLQRAAKRNQPLVKVAWSCSAALGLLAAIVLITAAFLYADLSHNLPSMELLPEFLEPPRGLLLQPTRLYDRTGEHVLLVIENPKAAEAEYLRLATASTLEEATHFLPANLIFATLAAVEPGYWQDEGFSLVGLLQSDHPGVSQRLVAEILLKDEAPGWRRALRERILAAQAIDTFGREKVLEWYLNHANFGRLAYGADAAARLYLGKSAVDLNLAECALLAGVIDAPNLNPIDAPVAALERQKKVIQTMLQYRMITPAEAIQAAQQELNLDYNSLQGQAFRLASLEPKIAPMFAQLVVSQLETQFKHSELERGGLRIVTSLDYDLQLQAGCAVSAQLGILQGASPEVTAAEVAECQAAKLLPTLPQGIANPLDGLSGGAIILDPLSGQILALTGELPPSTEGSFLTTYPAGSIVTPFIYLAALTQGLSPASMLWDIPAEASVMSNGNFDGKFHGAVRLRVALANDYLVPARNVLNLVGVEKVWRTAEQFGIISPYPVAQQENQDLFPFREINLLEISRAYGVFANQGILSGYFLGTSNGQGQIGEIQPFQLSFLQSVTILRVEDNFGNLLFENQGSQTQSIITPQLAYLMTHMLSDETARWPSLGHPNPLEVGRPAAAKNGRTEKGESHWTVGYTPQMVVAVWMGQQQTPVSEISEESRLLQTATAGIWHAILQYASRDLPIQTWSIPEGITTLEVCDPSGLLPTNECPSIVSEVFLMGSEPLQSDRMYRYIEVNRETGRLATVFTPPDLVEQRLYFVFPPQAVQWARQSELETPPEVYDILPAMLTTWEQAKISSPTMFAVVRGQVIISGSAKGEQFDFSRLQVGQGLNPHLWYQIGQDILEPVEEGQLAIWDTSGLNGLYALQLLVAFKDQSVKKATVLVTVDNQPPELEIVRPFDGEEIPLNRGQKLVFRVNVQDELELHSVRFYVDGELLGTLIAPPYALSWMPETGKHTLRVLAMDKAGNTREATIEFTVQ